MKTIIFMAIIAFVAAEYYDLVPLDMDEIRNNPDELKKFIDCMLDRGECSKLYSTYKDITPEAVASQCKKCSPYQKHSFWLFLQGMMAKFPSDYDNFRNKYDPENKNFEALESELRKYSIAF